MLKEEKACQPSSFCGTVDIESCLSDTDHRRRTYFIALKGSHFRSLFDFTAAGVVPCGGRKTSPRTSTIVQFIFYFGPLRSAIIF